MTINLWDVTLWIFLGVISALCILQSSKWCPGRLYPTRCSGNVCNSRDLYSCGEEPWGQSEEIQVKPCCVKKSVGIPHQLLCECQPIQCEAVSPNFTARETYTYTPTSIYTICKHSGEWRGGGSSGPKIGERHWWSKLYNNLWNCLFQPINSTIGILTKEVCGG